MQDKTIAIIATVECRSQTRGEDVPVAITIGGERLEIVDTLDRAMITTAVAGEPVRHRQWVEVSDGRRFELRRVLPDGPWRAAKPTVER